MKQRECGEVIRVERRYEINGEELSKILERSAENITWDSNNLLKKRKQKRVHELSIKI